MQPMSDRVPMIDRGQMGQMGQQMGIGGFNKSANRFKNIFFAMSLLTIGSSILGLIGVVSDILFSPFDLIIFSYLLIFGLVLFTLDCPYYHPKTEGFKIHTYKFCLFLTRFVGRAITYIFLGCMLMGNLWDNSIAPFIAFIIWFIFIAAGIWTGAFGFTLMRKLSKFRGILKQRNQPASSICPASGLSMVKFGELALATCGVTFNQEELSFVANALSQTIKADDIISQREFEYWMTDTTPVLI